MIGGATMSMWNDGSDPINAVQNRFTAYLTTAIKRRKYHYIKKKIQQDSHEVSVDDNEYTNLWPEEVDTVSYTHLTLPTICSV